MTEYQILCQHLPANHTKKETPFEADARLQVRALSLRGENAAYAANQYGSFTVFKWA